MWLKACGWSVVPQFFNSTVRLIFPSSGGGGGGDRETESTVHARFVITWCYRCRATSEGGPHYFVSS